MEELFRFWKNISQKVKDMIPMQVFPAVVKDVDADKRTCKVRVNDNIDIEDVRLYAVVDDSLKGLCLIPAKDSTVLVGRIANSNELFVCSFSVVDKVMGTIGDDVEIAIDADQLHYKNDKTEMTVKSNDIQVKTEKVTFTVSDSKVTVDADEVVFNGGDNDGMININDLTAKINELVQKFNDHEHIIPSIVTSVTGSTDSTVPGKPATVSGAGTVANVKAPKTLTPASKLSAKDYKDEKVKH